MSLKSLIKRWWPDRKFILSGGLFFAIRWVMSVVFFDILQWPAWFWSIVISVIITIFANVVYKEWVYKEKIEYDNHKKKNYSLATDSDSLAMKT